MGEGSMLGMVVDWMVLRAVVVSVLEERRGERVWISMRDV